MAALEKLHADGGHGEGMHHCDEPARLLPEAGHQHVLRLVACPDITCDRQDQLLVVAPMEKHRQLGGDDRGAQKETRTPCVGQNGNFLAGDFAHMKIQRGYHILLDVVVVLNHHFRGYGIEVYLAAERSQEVDA